MNSGPFRQISEDEAKRLLAAGAAVEHAEGIGWIAFDDIARQQTKAQADTIARQRRFERMRAWVASQIKPDVRGHRA